MMCQRLLLSQYIPFATSPRQPLSLFMFLDLACFWNIFVLPFFRLGHWLVERPQVDHWRARFNQLLFDTAEVLNLTSWAMTSRPIVICLLESGNGTERLDQVAPASQY